MGKRWITDQNGNKVLINTSRGGAMVAATALVGGIALAGGGGLGGAGSAGTAADAVAGQALRAKTAKGKSAARKGRYDTAWRRLGLRPLNRVTMQVAACAANSYRQVREFFLRTPCRSLDRTLLAIGDGAGNTFVVSIAWVRMRGSGAARELKALADIDGTGNVAAIGSVALDLAEVRFTGEYYDSKRRGSMTVISEAEPVTGSPDPATMHAATEVAVEFPKP
jgi:hypothetical protein